MKKKSLYTSCSIKNFLCFTFAFHLFPQAFAGKSCKDSFSDQDPEEDQAIFLFDEKKGYAYKGLTDLGLQKFKEERNKLRERAKLFQNNFIGMQNFLHALTTARIAHYHAFLEGPPGGAKTGLVNWFAEGETRKFKLTMDPMKPDQALIGGMRLDKAKEGLYVINHEGSIVDAEFALIDEMHLGNPAVLTILKNILNERKVYSGQEEVPVQLQSLFATSNATLGEIYDYFEAAGHGPSAAALFNRFQIKAFVYNWLPAAEQSELFDLKTEFEYMNALSRVKPNAAKDSHLLLKPDPIDWDFLHDLQLFLFTQNKLYKASFIELMNELRKFAHNQLRERQATSSKELRGTGAIPAEYSDRLMLQIDRAIKSSALLSLMLSPLADDENIGNIVKQPITLDQTSLWRAHLVTTTIASGIAQFSFFRDGETDSKSGLKLMLDITKHPDPKIQQQIDLANVRDDRESAAIQNVLDIQRNFAETFNQQTRKIKYQLQIVARSRSSIVPKNFKPGDQSFEVLLLNASGHLGEDQELIQKQTP